MLVRIKVGIVGGAGYTGGELIRLLINHPNVTIRFIHSKSNAGNPVYKVHQDLLGETDLFFTNELSQDIDLLYLCVGHGEARTFLEGYTMADHIRIIDLSQDFRLPHTASIRHHKFIYGLPELNKDKIIKAHYIANPVVSQCYSIGLLLGKRRTSEVYHRHYWPTGAGQSLTGTSQLAGEPQFQAYKTLTHHISVKSAYSNN
jgi:N-acetyl-gamma-glutamyl-phosphate reductase